MRLLLARRHSADHRFTKGLRALYAKGRCMKWLPFYNMNHVTGADRTRFVESVRKALPATRRSSSAK